MMSDLLVRQRLEQAEDRLSPRAARSKDSRGRLIAEEPCPLRTAYQRDRDRIIFCNAFRRLKHKTQVFIAPLGDHYVTRLTHTLEVSQIARTISRALNLNEDLTEAIALGHDLGHTPFGHIGEQVLNELLPGGFRHYEQSLRIVDCV
jgi:dGTPase